MLLEDDVQSPSFEFGGLQQVGSYRVDGILSGGGNERSGGLDADLSARYSTYQLSEL